MTNNSIPDSLYGTKDIFTTTDGQEIFKLTLNFVKNTASTAAVAIVKRLRDQ